MTDNRVSTMTINGEAVAGTAAFDVLNPATGEVIGSVPVARQADLDEAVAAANAAFPAWSSRPIAQRGELLRQLAQRIEDELVSLSSLLTAEQGKPISEATEEIGGGSYLLKAYTALDLPRSVLMDTAERRIETRRVPLGVVGAIVPWNYPFALSILKIGPAMLAGNTIVLKPSPFASLTNLRLGVLARDILPPGVLNVISGKDELGPMMTDHPGIAKISFTGSTATGKKVMAGSANSLKRVTLELGGNDAAIVLRDFDIENSIEALFWGAFKNAGQICMASKRIYVHAEIYDRVKQALLEYAKTISIGDGSREGTRIGPVNNELQYNRLVDLLQDSKRNGHRFLVGGDPDELPGLFLPVTIIDNPPEDARIVQEEQFGPVVPLLKFESVDDVIERVNASPYGLGASVWGADADRAQQVAERLDTGVAWINETQFMPPEASFGGRKQSGIGVESGKEGLLEFTSLQTILRKK